MGTPQTKKTSPASAGGGEHAPEEKNTRPVHRSPAFPFIPLKKAIERARAVHAAEGRNAARFSVIAKHWAYKPTSSGALQTVSALRQFGLLDELGDGSGQERTLRLTDRAIRILLDKREEERCKAIREAALLPKLYASLWNKWSRELPSAPSAESHLTIDLGFNPASAPAVFRAYKDTLTFAGLLGIDTMSDGDEDSDPSLETEREDMETTPNDPPKGGARREGEPPPRHRSEEEYLRAKLTGDRTVRILFQGPAPTRNEIVKLIALLELSKDQYPEASTD